MMPTLQRGAERLLVGGVKLWLWALRQTRRTGAPKEATPWRISLSYIDDRNTERVLEYLQTGDEALQRAAF